MRSHEHYTQALAQCLSIANEVTTSKWERASRIPQRSASPATMRRPDEQRSLKSWNCNCSIIPGFAVMSANDATNEVPCPVAMETGATRKQGAAHSEGARHVQN